jgi:hypothetical protein
MVMLLPALLLAIPLTDLGNAKYLDQFQGGLYENGSNVMPLDHRAAELRHESAVQPLDRNGDPSATGKIVLLSLGMSNTTQEFCATGNPSPCSPWSFAGQAAADPAVNHRTLAIVNGARGGQDAGTWIAPTDANYNLVRDNDLAPAGLTEKQVQVIWIKEANAQPRVSLPSPNADAYNLVQEIGEIVRAAKTRYPNLQLVYLSSRIYAGWATSTLNPEPYAYESGFAVKWVVGAQIEQRRSARVDPLAGDLDDAGGPWIGWGPYLWDPTWPRSDFESDGTHPAQPAEQKVGKLLLDFFKQKPWFLAEPAPHGRHRAVSGGR